MARRRWLGGAALVVLSLFVTAKLLLRSSFATGKVEAKLQEIVGGRVEVGQLDIGLNSSSLRDLQFYEQPAAGAPAPEQPWFQAKEVEADASLASLIEGNTPHLIVVRDADLTLRFDKSGKLLTQFPKSQGQPTTKPAELPSVKIVGGTVTVRQEGRPDFNLTGINLELTSAGNQLTLIGAIDDPNWGQWQANGNYDPAADSGSGTVKVAHLPVTPAKLESLPVIDPAVWKHFQLTGDIPLSVVVSRRPDDTGIHYRVTADPGGVRLSFPSADLTVTDVAGDLVMEDGILTLRDLHGRAAGGEIRTDAVLDFKDTPVKLQFDRVTAKGLDVHKLPASWNVPQQFGGQLVGQAKVTVTIQDGKVQTTGSGDAHLENARFLGQPAEVQLQLATGPRGLKFQQKQSPAGPPRESEPPPPPPAPPGAKSGVVVLLTGLLLGPFSQQPPPPAAGQPTYVTANLKVHDVDLTELVKQLKVNLPAGLTGKLSFSVSLSIPVNTPRDLKAYRMTGSASSSKLVIEQMELDDVKAEVVYKDGVLTLTDLSAKMPAAGPASGPLGSFKGAASLGVEPAGDLSARLTLDHIPLAQVRRLSPQAPDAAGTVSGSMEMRLPQGAFGDLTRWTANGNVQAEGLAFAGVGLGALRFNLALAQGQLRVHDITSDLPAGKITGSVDVPLTERVAGAANLDLQNVNVGALTRTVPNFPVLLEGRLSGSIKATIPPAQPNQGRAVNGDINLSSPELRIQHIPATALKASVTYRNGIASYSLVGKTLGGDFELSGTYPPKPGAQPNPQNPPPGAGRVRLRGAQLGDLWRALGVENSVAIAGRVFVELDYQFAPGKTFPTGSGRLAITDVAWPGSERTSRVQTGILLAENGIRVGPLSGELGGGQVSGAAVWGWRLPQSRRFRLRLDGVPSDFLLAPFPSVAPNLRGLVDAEFRGSLGRVITANGSVTVTRAQAYSTAVNEIRVPLTFDFDTRNGTGEVALSESTAQVAGGRVTGQARLRFGDTTQLEGNLQFYEVDIRTFITAYTSYGSYSQGKASGRATFSGTNVRSVADVTGRLTAQLKQTQALQLPILRQTVPFLGGGGAGYVTFSDGILEANLTRGVFQVRELSLTSRTAQLFVTGNVLVPSKILDLNLVAHTGQIGPNLLTLRVLGVQIPAVGPLPVSLILQVSDFLSNKTIQLHIGGTTDNPVVRVQPIRLLTEEAVRYFLLRAIPAPAGAP